MKDSEIRQQLLANGNIRTHRATVNKTAERKERKKQQPQQSVVDTDKQSNKS